MKLSTSMWSLDRAVQSEGLTQEGFIHWASEAGLKYVELLSYYMDGEKNLREIRDLLISKGIKVSCYTILSDFTTSEPDYGKLREDLETAELLGAPYVRVLGGDSSDSEEKARNNMAAGLRRAADEAEKRGLTLILENIGPYSCHSDQILSIMENCPHPRLRLNFDTANPLLADEAPLEALRKQLPCTSYIHVKDFITDDDPRFRDASAADPGRIQRSAAGRSLTGIRSGEGIVPLGEMVSILKTRDYDGFLSIEYEGTGDSVKDTEESLNHLRTLL